jgi:hypothetical protein
MRDDLNMCRRAQHPLAVVLDTANCSQYHPVIALPNPLYPLSCLYELLQGSDSMAPQDHENVESTQFPSSIDTPEIHNREQFFVPG